MKSGAELLLILVLCTSCTSQTPVGPFANVDLRPHVPRGFAARIPAEASDEHEHLVDVFGAKVKLTWKTFQLGDNKLLMSAQWSVQEAKPGFTFESLGVQGIPTYRGGEGAWVQGLKLGIRWREDRFMKKSFGDTQVFISADGASK